MNIKQEYSSLQHPTISEEEYLSLRMSGMMASEMASFDMQPPSWSNPSRSKKIYNTRDKNGQKRKGENEQYLAFYADYHPVLKPSRFGQKKDGAVGVWKE